MARGYRDAPYPALFLLREWRSMGGQIILTSDSHSTDTLLYGLSLIHIWATAALKITMTPGSWWWKTRRPASATSS